MNAQEFFDMHIRYLEEFLESDTAIEIPDSTSYIMWNEHFEIWVDQHKDEG